MFTVQNQETFILLPRDPGDWDLLVETLRPVPQPTDLSVVIGIRGGNAPLNMCNGLVVPVVTFDHLYTFDRDTLIGAIPRPEEASLSEENSREFERVALELFNRTMHMADNRGDTDAHRALNYLLVRDPTIYAKVAQELGRSSALSDVKVRPSALSTDRRILDVIFSFTNRNTDVVEKSFVRVDVTDEFPFLVTKMSPYYDLYA